MRILLLSITLSSILASQASVIPSEIRVNNRDVGWEIYNDAWLVKREDNDHITYKRRTTETEPTLPPVTTTEKPCTTPIPSTEAPTTTQRARTGAPLRRTNAGASRADTTSGGGRGLQPKAISAQAAEVSPSEGNYWWMVSHRSDNRITYTRRSNSSAETTTERTNPGQLRRLGHGDDSVVARVVNVGSDLAEEDVMTPRRKSQAGHKASKAKGRHNQHQVKAVQQETQSSVDNDSYPRIGEEHNGWRVVGKTKDQISWERVKEEGEVDLTEEEGRLSNLQLRSGLGQESHLEGGEHYISHNINDDDDADGEEDSPPRVGDVENGWRVIKKRKNHITWEKVEVGGQSLISRTITSGENQVKSASELSSSKTTSQFNVHEVESYPRVGDVVEGWRVVSKSNEHISWAKVGTENETDSADALRNQRRPSNLQLRSGDSVHYRNSEGAERVFPRTRASAGGQFPNEFETYSRATNPNFPKETVVGGTVRTSNSTAWSVGDELHGWKVIGKDYRGIIWEKMKNETEPTTQRPRLQVKSGDNLRRRGSNARSSALNQVQNGEFVRYLHPDGQERLYPRSRDTEVNNLLINSNLEGSNLPKTDSASKTATDPKRIGWYLAKERRNLITWQKDDVDPNAVYDHSAFPQIGHEQSGWKVSNKTRHHISWRRVGTDHLESDEQEVTSR